MSMATGAGMNRMTPNLQRGKSKGGLTPYSMQQFTPEQMNLFGSIFGHLMPGNFLSNLASGDESEFERMEAPAMRQFGQLQGQLSSRFSGGFGGERAMSARHGSSFQNAMNQATSDFAQDLQAKRLDIRNQALRDLVGMSSSLLNQRPYDQFVSPKKMSFLKQMLAGIAGPALQGALTGGTMGYMSRPSSSSIEEAISKYIPFIV